MSNSNDPISAQRQLWTDLLQEAKQRLLTLDLSNSSPEVASRAAYDLMAAIGTCRRWGVPISEDDQRLATPQHACLAAAEIMNVIREVKAEAISIEDRVDDAEGMDAEAICVDLLACREIIESTMTAIEDTYIATDHRTPESQVLEREIDALSAAVNDLDAALKDRADVLSLAATTCALENWQALLARERTEPLPWWLDGTLRVVATKIARQNELPCISPQAWADLQRKAGTLATQPERVAKRVVEGVEEPAPDLPEDATTAMRRVGDRIRSAVDALGEAVIRVWSPTVLPLAADSPTPSDELKKRFERLGAEFDVPSIGLVRVTRRLSDKWQVVVDIGGPSQEEPPVVSVQIHALTAVQATPGRASRWLVDLSRLAHADRLTALTKPVIIAFQDGRRLEIQEA